MMEDLLYVDLTAFCNVQRKFFKSWYKLTFHAEGLET